MSADSSERFSKIQSEVYHHGYDRGYKQGRADAIDDMASAVGLFIAQCGEMAEANWCPSQVEMLKRLFGAVLEGCEYANYELKEQE